MQESKQLRHKLYTAMLMVLITFVVAVTVTFAWYIYNTQQHTTNVHMAAGTGADLQINNTYGGTYGQSAILDEFTGTLNPVSTDKINGANAFQKVYGFSNGEENRSNLFASIFGPSESSDYYKTSLFLRTTGEETQIYISDIGYQDSDDDNPISTAIRVGIMPHRQGENQPEDGDGYIFEINTKSNPGSEGESNTKGGGPGDVLDSSKTDGTTIAFEPYNPTNFCDYNTDTGEVTLNAGSIPICTLAGSGGEAVQIDIYIWLEGCDVDCVNNLSSTTLRNLAVSFAGYEG